MSGLHHFNTFQSHVRTPFNKLKNINVIELKRPYSFIFKI